MKFRYRVLGFLSGLSAITYVDRVCISVAGEAIRADLELSLEEWGWILGAFVLAYGLFEIPTGALADRIGPRRVLTRIVLWWSLFTTMTGMVRGFWTMMITRFLFGVGEAGAYPNSSAVIARWFPVVERARAQGVVWMASRLGAALAPVIVLPIQHAWGWRASFYVFGVVGVAWAVLWHRWFRDNPKDKSGVSEGELEEIGHPEIANQNHSVPWRKAMFRTNLWWIMLMYHSQAWAGFFYLTWLTTFLVNGRGYTMDDLVAMSWLPFVFGAVANLVGGLASDELVKRIGLKWGRRMIGSIGLGAAAICTGATMLTDDKIVSVLLLALGYGFSDFTMPTAWAVCLDVGQGHGGAVAGAMNTAGQVGSFLTTVLFGYLVTGYGSYNAPLLVIAMMLALGAGLWLKIDASEPLIRIAATE